MCACQEVRNFSFSKNFRYILNDIPIGYKNVLKVNPLNASDALICTANQLTGFYMRATLAFNGLKKKN